MFDFQQETTSEDVEETEYEQAEKRDIMLHNLLILLNSAAALGLGPPAEDMGRQHPEEPSAVRAHSASKMPGSGKGIRRG